MADCRRTADFIREWNRMCSGHERCDDCPFWGVVCIEEADVVEVPEDVIAIVQKWSDEHPVVNPMMTWKGKLREMLPNADIGSIIESGCPHEYFGSVALIPLRDCTLLCADCWNSEYKEG